MDHSLCHKWIITSHIFHGHSVSPKVVVNLLLFIHCCWMWGLVLGPCFVVCSLGYLWLGRESLLLYFNLVEAVKCFFASFSQCRALVCDYDISWSYSCFFFLQLIVCD